MKLVWRAADETKRELGFNFPTVATVVLGITFSIIVGGIFSDSESDSLSGYQLWLIGFATWVLTVSVVFLLRCGWNIIAIAHRDRKMQAHLALTDDLADSVDGQMKEFIRNELSDPRYGVAQCYVFGSVIHQYPTHDVDVVIQYNSSIEHSVRSYRIRLGTVQQKFENFYGLKLHLQTFLFSEAEKLHCFLHNTGGHEKLI